MSVESVVTKSLQTETQALPETDSFKIAPLIKLTLLSFYTALMVPLPFLAKSTQAPIPPALMWLAMALGYVALWGALSERVEVDEEGIAVVYPGWVRAFGRRGWALKWAEITALKPRSTGQNGLVYYFLNQAQDRAYLLPVRVIGFARLVRYVEAKTDIDMRDVKPLAQPWMYLFLLVLTAILLLLDIWTITTAASL